MASCVVVLMPDGLNEIKERLRNLDLDMRAVMIQNAELDTTTKTLTKDVQDLTATVRDLKEVIAQGKGALYLIILFAGVISSALTLAIRTVVTKIT